MNRINHLLMIALIFILSACENENCKEIINESNKPISFNSSIVGEAASRSINSKWEENDIIGVFMKGSDKELSQNNIKENVNNLSFKTKNGNGHFTTESPIYYPEDGENVDFIAYYPFKENLSNFIYKINTQDQNNQENIDLLYSNNLTSRSQSSVIGNLQFYHQLAQLSINIKSSDNSDLSSLSISINNISTEANFNLANGEITNISSIQNIEMKRVDNSFKAILLPISSTNNIKLLLKYNGKNKEIALPTKFKSFKSGEKYSFSIDIKNGGSNVESEEAQYAKWMETPVIFTETLEKSNIHYINHYMPNDKNVRNYSLLYDSDLNIAYWVAYPYCSYYDGSSGRTDRWAYDPSISTSLQANLKSSFGNEYSRGHQIASGDRQRDKDSNASTFYYTNMTPQLQNGLNGTIWANLEGKVRGWATDTIFVVTGASPTTKTDNNIKYFTKENKKIAVPKYYYKALARKVKGNFITIAFKLENKAYPNSNGYMECALSVSDLEKETGFIFFPNLDSEIKSQLNKDDWK